MSTVLVSGGAGFIGTNLVNRILTRSENDVVVVDNVTYAANPHAVDAWERHDRVRFYRADIADRSAIEGIVAHERPCAVVNLAAETHVDRSIESPETFIRTNVNGTYTLLDVARSFWNRLVPEAQARFRFLQVSTDEVYGSLGATGLFSETTSYAPNSPYAASKAAADHLVRAYFHTYRLPTLITNCSNNYGPFQHPEKLIPLTILNALEGRPLPIYGDGSNVRDWLHVADHCDGILTVLDRGRPGEHYNIGATNEQTNVVLVNLLCDVLEELTPAVHNAACRAAGAHSYRELIRFVTDRPGHDGRYAVDATKVRGELGWRPRHTFRDGITLTVQWYLAHRDWYVADRIGYDRERLGLGAAHV